MSEVISIRIPRALKEEMKELDVDWAPFIRKTVEEKVKEERRRRAKKLMDESREKTKGVQFNSTEVIRSLREER